METENQVFNSFQMLAGYFGVRKPDEFFKFWLSLSDEEKQYYRTVRLEEMN